MTEADQERIEAIGEQLRQKITSKFTASTFLAGFALAVLTGQVFALWQADKLPLTFVFAVAIIFGAFVLFIEAIVRLDELTMPKRFWDEDATATQTNFPARSGYLADEDLWTLQKRMIFFWTRLTIVATYATVAAVILMLVPLYVNAADRIRAWAGAAALVGILVAAVYGLSVRRASRKNFPSLVRPRD